MEAYTRRVTAEQIRAARKENLYQFLLDHHEDEFEVEGNSLRWKKNHSLSIRKDYAGYLDFATSEHGNGIDFLTRYLRYDFLSAVQCLSKSSTQPADSPENDALKAFISKMPLPLPAASSQSQKVIDCLNGRGIPETLTRDLLDCGLLYQSAVHSNLVFVSKLRDFCEVRGTHPEIAFHQCRKLAPDRCWGYSTKPRPRVAFICEAAIDALSLCVLLEIAGHAPFQAMYCSIAGVGNQKAIERISSYLPVSILAVDNDDAGDTCRKRNQHLFTLKPVCKDWNEDLQKYLQTRDACYLTVFDQLKEVLDRETDPATLEGESV